MLNLPQAVELVLQNSTAPIITDYELFLMIRRIYATKQVKDQRVSIRRKFPTHTNFRRVIEQLLAQRVLRTDPDFRRHDHEEFRNSVFRVVNVPDGPAEEITALVDPFCYISHLSAMQRYGLTNRVSKALTLTTPAAGGWRKLREMRMTADYGPKQDNGDLYAAKTVVPLQRISFPAKIRNREVLRHDTKYPDQWQQIRGSHARLTAVGNIFVQMLERPAWCGGMLHVLNVFEKHAKTYREEIISAVERFERPIVKVRAGYILEERLNWNDPRIMQWRSLAQRGSSRVLDPEKPFAPTFSANWMLSLNV